MSSRALKYQKVAQQNGYCTQCYKKPLLTKWLCIDCKKKRSIYTKKSYLLKKEPDMSIATKIEVVKGLLATMDKDTKVTLLVPKGYILFADEFKAIDERIKEVKVNQVNGWSLEVIQ